MVQPEQSAKTETAITYTEAELIELYEERAAIREYEAKMSRREAQQAAYWDWRKLVGDVAVPDYIKRVSSKFAWEVFEYSLDFDGR